MLASHWAQKVLVLLSPVGEQHRLSVPECVRTRLLLSRHSVLYLSGSFKVVRCNRNLHFLLYQAEKELPMTRENVRQNHSNLHLFPFSRPSPFSRTLHFRAFPTLSHLPQYLRAWNRLKSLKC